MCTAALIITDSKLTVKTTSSVMKLPVSKYIIFLGKIVLSSSIFVSSVVHTCDRDCAGRGNIADVLFSQCNSISYSGAAGMLQLVTAEKRGI